MPGRSHWSDIWYWLLSFAVLSSLWVSAANTLSPAVTAFVLERGMGASYIPAGVIAMMLLVGLLNLARFTGPIHASYAEISWRTHETRPSQQLLQILGISLLIVFLAGSPLVTFALDLSWNTTELAVLAAALVLIAPIALVSGIAMQRSSSGSVPRWRLLRADANVTGALMTVLTLDGSALRLAADLRDSGRRRRLATRSSSPAMRLFTITSRRTLGRMRKHLLILAALTVVSTIWGPAMFTMALALVSAIFLAVDAAGSWCDWVSEPRIRYGFARLGGKASAAVLLGSAFWPTLYLVAGIAVASIQSPLVILNSTWSWLAWPLIAAILPLDVLTSRGVAALRAADGREGQDVINTLELGPIPVGTIRRLTAGWLGGAVVVTISFFSPELAAAILAVKIAATFHRYRQLTRAGAVN